MNIETKYLEKFKSEKTFIDIYTDGYEESVYACIIDFNDIFLLIEKFEENSDSDGVSILLRENLTRIRWGGNEITSASKLVDDSKRLKKISTINLNSVNEILKDVYDFFGHVTVHIQDIDSTVCIIGEIHEIDNDTIVINEFGTLSSLDRKFIMLSLDNITRIDGGGQYETKLISLFNN